MPPGAVREDFRRAVRSTIAVWVLGVLLAVAIVAGEPALHAEMLHPVAIGAVTIALLAGLAVIACVRALLGALAASPSASKRRRFSQAGSARRRLTSFPAR